jgi:hypothetical protein
MNKFMVARQVWSLEFGWGAGRKKENTKTKVRGSKMKGRFG